MAARRASLVKPCSNKCFESHFLFWHILKYAQTFLSGTHQIQDSVSSNNVKIGKPFYLIMNVTKQGLVWTVRGLMK